MCLSFLELQNRIRAALPPSDEPCAISRFVYEYRALHGELLPFEQFGYNSARDLLESMREVALVTAYPNGFVSVQAVDEYETMDPSESIDKRRRRRAVKKAPSPLPPTKLPPRTSADLTKDVLLAEIRNHGAMRISELDHFCVRIYGVPLSLENANRILGTKASNRHQAFITAFENIVQVEFDNDGNHMLTYQGVVPRVAVPHQRRAPPDVTRFVVNANDALGGSRNGKTMRELFVEIVRRFGCITHYNLKARLLLEHNLELTLESMNKAFGTQKNNPIDIIKEALPGLISVTGICKSPGKELYYTAVKASTSSSLDEHKPVAKLKPQVSISPVASFLPSPPSSSSPVLRPEYRLLQLLADFMTTYITGQAGIMIFVADIARVLISRYGHIPDFYVPTTYDGCLKLAKNLASSSNGTLELTYINDLGFLKLARDLPIVPTSPTDAMFANMPREDFHFS